MNTAYQTPEPFTVPDGGLASFLSATTGSWAEDENITPNGGISNVSRAADQLAQFGRNGDTYMVHAAEGETFIPKEVLEANPGLKESLFSQMRSMGVENPERYIVGSDLNSLNPITGQPEFFLGKIWKSLKGVVKGVIKVVKKIAPIIIPFAIDAFLPGLGSIAAGALGSGIGTLIQGGDIKDAFKSAAMGGFAGGMMGGFRNVAQNKSFFDKMLPSKTGAFKLNTDNWITKGLGFGDKPPSSSISSSTSQTTPSSNRYTARRGPSVNVKEIDLTSSSDFGLNPFEEGTLAFDNFKQEQYLGPNPNRSVLGGRGEKLPVRALKTQAPPVIPSSRTVLTGGGDAKNLTFKQARDQLKNRPDMIDYLKKGEYSKALFGETNTLADLMDKFPGLEDKQYEALLTTNPSILRKFGPSAAIALGATAAFGGFDRPVPPKIETASEKAAKLYAANPQKYSTLPLDHDYFAARRYTPQYYTPRYAAGGGEMYPERIGAIDGPGTGVSDDVPALLSDGEFVMTARAVRGAGDGSRDKGVRKMYQMMRRFEGGAV
jgi:hypothetical protein